MSQGTPATEEQRQQVLDDVRAGVHPSVACAAAGLSTAYFHRLRHRARSGDQAAIAFADAIGQAQAQGEAADVRAATRGTHGIEDDVPIICPQCNAEYEEKFERLVAMVSRYESAAKAKSLAADIALKKLERRHPARWSQKVIHTVQEEHERLLNVCQRELPPEMFERVLETYLSEVEGGAEPQAPAPSSDPVH